MTPAEQILWGKLRNRGPGGIKFHRQYPMDRFVLDFYSRECKLAIEIDGSSHADSHERDAERTAWLQARGYRVIRVTNDDVINNLTTTLQAILTAAQSTTEHQTP